ncbi:MAG: hypothetical protein QMC80_02210 [Thermoplasmatales archaeon]|nr:hypothetical protein [Thermoplasmatales archaeon]
MVVVDSSVLIPLSRIGRLNLLRKIFKEIKVTEEIYKEVVKESEGRSGTSEIEKACKDWIEVCKIKSRVDIQKIAKSEGIEKADVSIVLLAKETKDILLSNDKSLIVVGKSKGVICWWLTTFILNLVKKRLVTKKDTKQVSFELVEAGMRLRVEVYAALLKEIDRL